MPSLIPTTSLKRYVLPTQNCVGRFYKVTSIFKYNVTRTDVVRKGLEKVLENEKE